MRNHINAVNNAGFGQVLEIGWCWFVLIAGAALIALSCIVFDPGYEDGVILARIREWSAVSVSVIALALTVSWGVAQQQGAATWLSLALVATLLFLYGRATDFSVY
jgi:hypothetical protein